jgi:hypothetical protein
MSLARETASDAATQPNSLASIQERVAAGRIPWIGPLLLVSARSFMWMASQALLALVFLARHRPAPWREATYWWSVCGTLGDIVCLIALRYFTRREGICLRDLLGPIRMRRGRDLFLGLCYLLLVFPFFMGGGYLAQMLFYGSTGPNPATYLVHAHALPIWAMVYSVTLWWLISSPTEEATYQGYALPRLEALTGRTWIAVAIVGFWATAQHCAFGFIPDWRFLTCRFLAFLPGCLVIIGIYLRTRRLMPLIFAHWPMDIAAVLLTAF